MPDTQPTAADLARDLAAFLRTLLSEGVSFEGAEHYAEIYLRHRVSPSPVASGALTGFEET